MPRCRISSIDSVVLQPVVTPLPSNFGLYGQLSNFNPYGQPYNANVPQLAWPTTYLSTQQLSAAGLAYLQIASNTTITVNAGRQYLPGPRPRETGVNNSYQSATMLLTARAIDLQGQINVPAGNVNLSATDNKFANEFDRSCRHR